jgi:hypothetical protein
MEFFGISEDDLVDEYEVGVAFPGGAVDNKLPELGRALVVCLATMHHPFLELLPPAGKPKKIKWSAGAWSVFALLFTSGLGVYLSTRP